MKTFISIPMKGKDEEEIRQDMENITNYIINKHLDADILDSFIRQNPPENVKHNAVWYLGKSLEVLAQADLAVFANDWAEARGCIIEHQIATAYEIPTLIVKLDD